MNSAELRRKITIIAHSLACAHQEPSYVRPQYFTLLCQALDPDIYSDLKRFVTEELIDVVAKQCGRSPNPEELDLLWRAFGIERVDSKADFGKRSAAYKAFAKLIETSELPEEVVSQALVLHSSPSLVKPRMLQLSAFPRTRNSMGLYKDPLAPIDSLLSLGAWKLGQDRRGVVEWRDWLLNMVHEQSWFRFKCGRPAFLEHEDVEQEVLARTLVQMCVYQPAGSVPLDRWAFATVNLAIGMSFRTRRGEVQGEPFPEGHEEEGTEYPSTGPAVDEDAKSEAVDLVEYAMMRLDKSKSKYPPQQRVRAKVLASMLGPLIGTNPARDADELSSQLQSFFPNITDSQVATILEHSGLQKGEVHSRLTTPP